MFRSIPWKRHRRLVFALTAGFLILIVGFGGTRVSAITSSERHATDAFISVDIPGRVDLFDDTQVHEIAIKFDMADYERLIAVYQQDNEKEFIEASITIDGTTISPVGIRLKGNSTLMGLRRAGQTSGQGGAAIE
jgi:spore coat protein CotH